ncbi:MAG TPA: hypothetical protein VFA43_23380 [Gemmatimonadaceae bacterium]|nr:hypothetical protein [Gemmatimonadaceae bacterium]
MGVARRARGLYGALGADPVTKQSNDFQRFVGIIERLAAPETAKVDEPAELSEKGGLKREVDVIIEDNIDGILVRAAVECRDRTRPGTIQWIDELFGKYYMFRADGIVQKVVAVSSSGFTKDAIKRAADYGITALTVKEALDQDWEQFGLAKLFVRLFGYEAYLGETRLEYDRALNESVDEAGAADWLICEQDGTDCRRVTDVVMEIYDKEVHSQTDQFLRQTKLIDPANPVDKQFSFYSRFEFVGALSLRIPDGSQRSLSAITINVHGWTHHLNASRHKRIAFDKKLVTVATFDDTGMGAHTVTLAQIVGDKTRVVRGIYEPGVGTPTAWTDRRKARAKKKSAPAPGKKQVRPSRSKKRRG